MALPTTLARFAKAFYLFGPECLHRISHHMAHVAPENWLAAEFAELFNTRTDEFDATGWSALLECKFVDVTLVPPWAEEGQGMPDGTIYVELKLVATDWWNTNWRDVWSDLTGLKSDADPKAKPNADFEVCFLSNALRSRPHKMMEATKVKYEGFMEGVPLAEGWFQPVPNGQRFYLTHTSAEHRLVWDHPVFERWPQGYEAEARVLWVSLGPDGATRAIQVE